MTDVTRAAAIIATRVSHEGVAFLSGEHLRSLISPVEFGEFVAAWDDLGPDAYLPGGATYRTRRYGRLLAKPGLDGGYTLNPLQLTAFQQPADLIPLYEGRPRIFASIKEAALGSHFLAALISLDLAVITSSERSQNRFIVGLHMVRIVAQPGFGRLPAPEGRHADGHCYVAMHLIKKRGCEGGQSRIFLPGSSEPMLEITLTESLDTLIVDDRRVEHAVTAVRALECEGIRDMLLVDFDLDSSQQRNRLPD
jgi:hypothetical protein